ncbi:MAG: hypothetical protein QXR45_09015 [Candidatus Bathyarchaeia archaeon]
MKNKSEVPEEETGVGDFFFSDLFILRWGRLGTFSALSIKTSTP